MVDLSQEVVHTLNTENQSGKKKSSKQVVILVLLLFGITLATALVLIVKNASPVKDVLREKQFEMAEIPDLYSGAPIEIVEPLFVRARFINVGENTLRYGVFSPRGDKITDLKLNERIAYGCTERFMTTPDGTQIDRLQMYITTENEENFKDIPDPANKKSLGWFKENVNQGEAIEVRSVTTQDGSVVPRIIYVYKETCP